MDTMKELAIKALVSAFLLAAAAGLYACDKPATSVGNTAQAATTGQEAKAAPAKPADAPAATADTADKVVAYYFHGDRRCRTCLGIQSAIEQTIRERFAAETALGKLAYREVNIDQEINKPFVQQFQLSFSTLIVATMTGDKTLQWENCEKAWEYSHEPPRLMDYAAERIKANLVKLEAK